MGRGRQRGWRLRKRFWIGAVLVAAALFVVIWGLRQFQPVDASSHAVRYIRVNPGESADQVAVNLSQAGIIRSAWVFELVSRWDNASTDITAGVYRLSPRDSVQSILEKMRRGEVAETKVTIPEGFTVQEIVARLLKAHIGTATQYHRLEQTALPGMPKPALGVRDPLEGFLYPATYEFPHGTTARQALMMMWQTFQSRVIHGVFDRAHSQMTLVQWVTLASIVQDEDQKGSQARAVAGVFVNRLQAGMPLQSDATVRYAIGHALPHGLSLGNLQYPSPYNTYRHKGLPPGPITNPGMEMLQAALHPSHEPYLYFLSLRNGTMLFATTYAQHLANIAYANAHPNG